MQEKKYKTPDPVECPKCGEMRDPRGLKKHLLKCGQGDVAPKKPMSQKRGRKPARADNGNGEWAEFKKAVGELAQSQVELTEVSGRVEKATRRVESLAEKIGTVIPVSEIPKYISERL